MNKEDIIRMARNEYDIYAFTAESLAQFAALVAAEVHKAYSPIGTVAGGAAERTFMHPSVKYVLPTGLQLYARIEVREEDKV